MHLAAQLMPDPNWQDGGEPEVVCSLCPLHCVESVAEIFGTILQVAELRAAP